MCTLSFDENGRFVDGDGDWGDFSISGNSLTLAFDDFTPITVNFELRRNPLPFIGDRLILTGPDLRIVLDRA